MRLTRRARTPEDEEARQEALNFFGPPWWTKTVIVLVFVAMFSTYLWGDTAEVDEALKSAMTPAAVLVAAAVTGLALIGSRLNRDSARNLAWNPLTRTSALAVPIGVAAIGLILLYVALSATPLADYFRSLAAGLVVTVLFSTARLGWGLVEFLGELRRDPEEREP